MAGPSAATLELIRTISTLYLEREDRTEFTADELVTVWAHMHRIRLMAAQADIDRKLPNVLEAFDKDKNGPQIVKVSTVYYSEAGVVGHPSWVDEWWNDERHVEACLAGRGRPTVGYHIASKGSNDLLFLAKLFQGQYNGQGTIDANVDRAVKGLANGTLSEDRVRIADDGHRVLERVGGGHDDDEADEA